MQNLYGHAAVMYKNTVRLPEAVISGQAIVLTRRRFTDTKSKYLNQQNPIVASADRDKKTIYIMKG